MTKQSKKNHYENAFENWLIDKKIEFVPIDQTKRTIFKKAKIKSFDFIVPAKNNKNLLIEIKGRKFKANSLDKISAMQSWVTMDDVDGLDQWQKVFGDDYQGVFTFAYELEKPDIDSAGAEVFEFEGRCYSFFMIQLNDYKQYMVLRSPKWKTVAMLTEDFKKCVCKISEIIF